VAGDVRLTEITALHTYKFYDSIACSNSSNIHNLPVFWHRCTSLTRVYDLIHSFSVYYRHNRDVSIYQDKPAGPTAQMSIWQKVEG